MKSALLKLPFYERFGRFELLRRIDEGGMAEVILAREPIEEAGKRLVALKRLLRRHEDDSTMVQMFRDEARLAVMLDHPGIVRAYESGVIAGRHYLSLEWIHGVSLATLASGVPWGLPVAATLRFVADVAAAVHFTHGLKDRNGQPLGVVHRDITPPNIMIGFDGSVKILDFGMAKASTQTLSTATGFVKGKLRYLAPEQVVEGGGEPSWRIDVFTLGLCAFEALAGRPLFDNENPMDAVRAIQEYQAAPSIRALRGDVPEGVDELLRCALQPDPALRFHSARSMGEAVLRELEKVDAGFDNAELGRLVTELFPIEAVSII